MKKIIRTPLYFPIYLAAILFLICMAPSAFGWQEVTISWDPNTEEDLEGYAVYIQENASGPPYEFLVALNVDEMADMETPMVTLTELEPDTQYHVAVKAYDSMGNESAFSDDLCIQVFESSIVGCASAVTDDTLGTRDGSFGGVSSNSSGGGGGCFIQTTGTGFNPADGMPGIILLIWVVVYFLIRRLDSEGRRRP